MPDGSPQHPPAVPPIRNETISISSDALSLIQSGIENLWQRVIQHDDDATGAMMLSFDVHPSPDGPVLIEVNTNAGGTAAALAAAAKTNSCCAEQELRLSEHRIVQMIERGLGVPIAGQHIAIVDDQVVSQPLYEEMQWLALLLERYGAKALVADATTATYDGTHLVINGHRINAVYWRSTDFRIDQSQHIPFAQAVADGAIRLAPSPNAYQRFAQKENFIDWSRQPILAESDKGLTFRIAETVPLGARTTDEWYEDRKNWVFKPLNGYASRGVYVGNKISRNKLASLEVDHYVAQLYTPHPKITFPDGTFKYDLRFYTDRNTVISAAARLFRGQVMGMTAEGSGFAALQIGDACCIQGALLGAPPTSEHIASMFTT